MWFEKCYAKTCHGTARLARYADDLPNTIVDASSWEPDGVTLQVRFSARAVACIRKLRSLPLLSIVERYQVKLLEIGTDQDHVLFLVQSVPLYSVTKLVMLIKSITARKTSKRCPELRRISGAESS